MTTDQRIDKWHNDQSFLINDILSNNIDAIYDRFDQFNFTGIHNLKSAKSAINNLLREKNNIVFDILTVPFDPAGSNPISKAYIAYLIQRSDEGNGFVVTDPLLSIIGFTPFSSDEVEKGKAEILPANKINPLNKEAGIFALTLLALAFITYLIIKK